MKTTTIGRKKNALFVQSNIDIRETLVIKGKNKRYITDYLDKYHYIVHLVNYQNSVAKNDKGWSYLSSAILLELMYNKYTDILSDLVNWGYLLCNNQYIVGEQSKGYKIAPLHQGKVISLMILNERFAANLERKKEEKQNFL